MKATVTDVTKRIETKPDKTVGIISYDVDNKYPQRIVDIINSSGTGTLCTAIFGKFIYGGGFVNEVLAKTVVNTKKQTVNKLLFKSGKSISKFNGIAIHINYNANFQKTTFNIVPFQDVRFTTKDNKNHPNMLAVYDDWEKIKNRKIEEKNIDFIDFYDPDPDAIQRQVDKADGWNNYKGQILYWSVDGIEYPLAPSDSVLEDVQTDSHAKIFKFRNITTNFMATHIIETNEFEDQKTKDAFLDTLTDFQGGDDASKILLLEKEADDPSFNLTKVDIQDIEKLYEFTEESVRNNIIRNYLIPPVLLLAVAGKLGSSSEIRDATAFYNGITEDHRTAVEEIFVEIFDKSIFNVGNEFDIIEVQAKTVPVRDTPEGKKEIIALLGNSTLSEKQKKTILEVVYEFSKEEALRLIPTMAATEEGGEEAVDEEAKARAALKGSVGGVTGILAIQSAVSAGTIESDAGAAVLELIFGMSPTEATRMLTKKDLNVS